VSCVVGGGGVGCVGVWGGGVAFLESRLPTLLFVHEKRYAVYLGWRNGSLILDVSFVAANVKGVLRAHTHTYTQTHTHTHTH